MSGLRRSSVLVLVLVLHGNSAFSLQYPARYGTGSKSRKSKASERGDERTLMRGPVADREREGDRCVIAHGIRLLMSPPRR